MRKSNTKRNQKIALFSPLLIPLSFLYWLVVEIRNFLFLPPTSFKKLQN